MRLVIPREFEWIVKRWGEAVEKKVDTLLNSEDTIERIKEGNLDSSLWLDFVLFPFLEFWEIILNPKDIDQIEEYIIKNGFSSRSIEPLEDLYMDIHEQYLDMNSVKRYRRKIEDFLELLLDISYELEKY